MAKLIGRKFVELILVMFAVSFLTFLLLSLLPGDPALVLLGPNNATPEAIERVTEELGLNDPIFSRYGDWLAGVLQGDLGTSPRTNQPVMESLLDRLPVTVQLVGMTFIVSLLISIPLGIFSAHRAGSKFDAGVASGSFTVLSIPDFMMALGLIIVFAVKLNWLPATGWTKFGEDPVANLKGCILPVSALAMTQVAVLTRVLRSDMIATLQQDYIQLARAKGLPTRRVLFRYAFPPSSLSLLTLLGLQLGAAIGGTLVIEQIFALPGMGRFIFTSISTRDLLVVQGGVLLVSLSFVVMNFIVDLMYSVVDPRIRHDAG